METPWWVHVPRGADVTVSGSWRAGGSWVARFYFDAMRRGGREERGGKEVTSGIAAALPAARLVPFGCRCVPRLPGPARWS